MGEISEIKITNDAVFLNGEKIINIDNTEKKLAITVLGNIETLHCDKPVEINSNTITRAAFLGTCEIRGNVTESVINGPCSIETNNGTMNCYKTPVISVNNGTINERTLHDRDL